MPVGPAAQLVGDRRSAAPRRPGRPGWPPPGAGHRRAGAEVRRDAVASPVGPAARSSPPVNHGVARDACGRPLASSCAAARPAGARRVRRSRPGSAAEVAAGHRRGGGQGWRRSRARSHPPSGRRLGQRTPSSVRKLRSCACTRPRRHRARHPRRAAAATRQQRQLNCSRAPLPVAQSVQRRLGGAVGHLDPAAQPLAPWLMSTGVGRRQLVAASTREVGVQLPDQRRRPAPATVPGAGELAAQQALPQSAGGVGIDAAACGDAACCAARGRRRQHQRRRRAARRSSAVRRRAPRSRPGAGSSRTRQRCRAAPEVEPGGEQVPAGIAGGPRGARRRGRLGQAQLQGQGRVQRAPDRRGRRAPAKARPCGSRRHVTQLDKVGTQPDERTSMLPTRTMTPLQADGRFRARSADASFRCAANRPVQGQPGHEHHRQCNSPRNPTDLSAPPCQRAAGRLRRATRGGRVA